MNLCTYHILIDFNSGEILSESESDLSIYPASMTKIMTTIVAYDLIKIVAHMASIYLVYRFSKDYFSNDRALILAVVFVMYPLHDTTTYWYMTFSYILVPSVCLYAHHLIRKNKE